MQAGFVVRVCGTRAEFTVNGDTSTQLPLVSVSREHNHAAALMGRLYYRDELWGKLPKRADDLEDDGDAALALAVYLSNGTAGLSQLEGDFCLVVWDGDQSRLIASRDPMGGFPLYWSRRADQFIIGTSIRFALKLLSARRLNLDFIAEHLMTPSIAIQERPAEQCVYEGIQRVLPGYLVSWDARTSAFTRQPYWDWLERLNDPGTGRVEEIAEQLGYVLRQAVQERVRGRTAAHFSGGMDSTSIALIARDWLKASTGQPLHTLSLVFNRMASVKSERSYIEAALDRQCGLIHQWIGADDMLAYDNFVQPPYTDEPFMALLDLKRDGALIEAAEKADVQTILAGHGGDDLIGAAPHHLADLARGWHILTAYREAQQWGRAWNAGSLGVLYRFGLANLLPTGLRAGLRSAVRRGEVDWKRQVAGSIAPWVRRDFARSHHLYRRGLRNLHWLYDSCRPASLANLLSAIQAYVGDGRRWWLGAPRGIMLARPFTDPRLLTLGLGIRLRFRPPPGTQKPLLAHAMRDVLPDKIRNRRGKAHFNEIYFKGLARNLKTLEGLVGGAPIDDLFDRDMLISCLRQAAWGIQFSPSGITHLDLALPLISWLTNHQRWHCQNEFSNSPHAMLSIR